MVNISTDETKYQADELIFDNESFFNNNVSSKDFTNDSIEIIKKIDNAELLDVDMGKIKTPYGICGISDLSSGCKTILNYLYIKVFPNKYPNIKAINAIECGWNALEELFRLIDRNADTIEVLLQHENGVYKCSDRKYCIDGKRYINTMYDF